MSEALFYIMAILLFISGCAIIFLKQRTDRVLKDFEEKVNEMLAVRWDEEYRNIVATYGSAEDYVKAHLADYNIIRSNILIFIAKIDKLGKGIDVAFDCLINDEDVCSDKINRIKIESIQKSVASAVSDIVKDAESFVKSEEEAHSEKQEMKEILEKLDKEVKKFNFYE